MKIRQFFFNYIIGKKLLIKFIDNIFFFSNLKIESYFDSMPKVRRESAIRESLISVGIGYRNSNPMAAEQWLIEHVLVDLLRSKDLIFFDVGANLGDYSNLLKMNFINASIYSFEPNPETYEKLDKRFVDSENVRTYNIGFSSKENEATLYSYLNNPTSGHASTLKDVFSQLYMEDSIKEFKIVLSTLDLFANKLSIKKIDFLKIDTEGLEYDILIGASNLIKENRISIIQFEFNEMNIIKRKFLLDFFNLLDNYKIYRLLNGNILDISKYKSEFEIFWYQNIICISNEEGELIERFDWFSLK